MTGQPGDAAILANLDFAPACPIVEQRTGRGPAETCTRTAIMALRLHDCRTPDMHSVIACGVHAQQIADSVLPWLARAVRLGNRCPGCGFHFTRTDHVLSWEDL